MKIISKTKKGGRLFLRTIKKYWEITLDEKLDICRKYKGIWEGGSYESGITTLILKLK